MTINRPLRPSCCGYADGGVGGEGGGGAVVWCWRDGGWGHGDVTTAVEVEVEEATTAHVNVRIFALPTLNLGFSHHSNHFL